MAKRTIKTAAIPSEPVKDSNNKIAAPKSAPAKKAATKKNVTKSSAARTGTAKKSTVTTTIAIRALVDVGFGNHLHIRGEGAGLSWDNGQLMACLGSSEWQWTCNDAVRPIPFKVLINDHIWSVGDDYIAVPGEITLIEPAF